jgi:Holliday junction DNA helicase RuvB
MAGFEPKSFSEIVGQDRIKRELIAMIANGDTSNVLLRGNAGGGKTTLAKMYAAYRGDYTYQDVPDVLRIPNDSVRTHVIDEIHLAGRFEILYEEMGKHTYVFCTTERAGLPMPFVSRCVELVLDDYTDAQLTGIVQQKADKEGIEIDKDGAKIIASRGRGMPRVTIQLLHRIHNLSAIDGEPLSARYVAQALDSLKVYPNGLIEDDLNYLLTLNNSLSPVSLRTLSATLNRAQSYVEETIESFLLYKRFISITPRGRIITALGKNMVERMVQS